MGGPPTPRLSRRSGNPDPFISIAWVGIRRTPRLLAKQTGRVWTAPALPHVLGCGKGLWIPAAARKTGVGHPRIGSVNAIALDF